MRFPTRPPLLALALLLSLAACEKEEAAPPPEYPPATPSGALPEDATSQQAIPEPYASDEVMIGEDTSNYADADPNALTDFHAALDPHGAWVDDPQYGTVWVPSAAEVGPDFQPYVTAGHWAYDDDYVWVSDYDWGWAPFHYGRWVFVDGRGWAWIPGRRYAGAWVVWRVGDEGYGYVGWAPAPPLWFWFGGYPYGVTYVIAPRYVYCPRGDVFAPAVAHRIVAAPQVAGIAAHTRPYTPASPSVGAAGAAGGTAFAGHLPGPPPSRLGMDPARVPRLAGNEPGVSRAQQFAKPSTAMTLGAHPPQPTVRPGFPPNAVGGSRGIPGAAGPRIPSNPPLLPQPRGGVPNRLPTNPTRPMPQAPPRVQPVPQVTPHIQPTPVVPPPHPQTPVAPRGGGARGHR